MAQSDLTSEAFLGHLVDAAGQRAVHEAYLESQQFGEPRNGDRLATYGAALCAARQFIGLVRRAGIEPTSIEQEYKRVEVPVSRVNFWGREVPHGCRLDRVPVEAPRRRWEIKRGPESSRECEAGWSGIRTEIGAEQWFVEQDTGFPNHVTLVFIGDKVGGRLKSMQGIEIVDTNFDSDFAHVISGFAPEAFFSAIQTHAERSGIDPQTLAPLLSVSVERLE